MNATVLVTGGNGFVGSHCIVELLRQGFQVRATLRDLSKEAPARTAIAATGAPLESLSFVAVQLTQDAGWDTALHGCDYVLHVASPLGASQPNDPNELIVPARDGTLRVLAAAARAAVKRVVMTACLRAARRRCPGVGFCVVDVRDLAALHVRAMLTPHAAGQRFIAAGDFGHSDHRRLRQKFLGGAATLVVSALRRGAARLQSRCGCRQSPHAELFRRRNPSRLDRRRDPAMHSPDPCDR
jgi:NAD(P)-dependent dehydrogenase (short-subunit alcohol dehydrogenase family)